MSVRAFAAQNPGSVLEQIEIQLPKTDRNSVTVDVEFCGICHSDLSMIDNAWGMTQYPIVAGHEIIGTVRDLGETAATQFKIGDRVGIGWFSKSCRTCSSCLDGYYNMCFSAEQTIVGRPGGFADQVRVDSSWVMPLPETLDPAKAAPLFCGGITVFSPLLEYGIRPTDRVGVVGIGGLGHLAIKFLRAWGCEVTAFTSSESKMNEAKSLGAHHVLNSKDSQSFKKIAGSLDFVLVTVNATLDWPAFLNTLGPKGRLHFVGGVLEPVQTEIFSLLGQQKAVSASPLGKPISVKKMLEFSSRHNIEPITESFAMKDINDAIEHLRSGKARYRVILKN